MTLPFPTATHEYPTSWRCDYCDGPLPAFALKTQMLLGGNGINYCRKCDKRLHLGIMEAISLGQREARKEKKR